MKSINDQIVKAYESQSSISKHELVCFIPVSNENELTYDGIDNCGHRVVHDIDEFIAKLEGGDTASTSNASILQEKKRVTRFSIVGYSLGGCVARFALGVLHARTPSFFDSVEPCNFTTIASPAIGIPRFPGRMSAVLNTLGAKLLSRTGEQLYAGDDYHSGKPLLEVMSQPGTSFYDAVMRFKHKSIYANSMNDRTVPFATGAFPMAGKDNFARAARLARKHQVRETDPLDFDLGGLKITMDPECPYIVKSVEETVPQPVPTCKQRGFRMPSLPFFLKPSTFKGMPYKLGYVMPLFMPVLIPAFLVYITTSFKLQSRRSRRRIRNLGKGEDATLEGQLRRVGIALEDTLQDIAEDHVPFAPDVDSGNTSLEAQLSGFTGGSDAEGRNAVDEDNAILLPSQKRMVDNLNGIPDLQKIFVHMPEVRHAHGAIIARDLSFDDHKKGLEVLGYWATRFEF